MRQRKLLPHPLPSRHLPFTQRLQPLIVTRQMQDLPLEHAAAGSRSRHESGDLVSLACDLLVESRDFAGLGFSGAKWDGVEEGGTRDGFARWDCRQFGCGGEDTGLPGFRGALYRPRRLVASVVVEGPGASAVVGGIASSLGKCRERVPVAVQDLGDRRELARDAWGRDVLFGDGRQEWRRR